MKFGVVFDDYSCLETFKKLVAITAKQSKLIVMRMTRTHVFLISCEDQFCKVNCQFFQRSLFAVYVFEGISADCDEICIQVNGDYFFSVLRSISQYMRKLKVKLLRGQQSYLSLEVEHPPQGDGPRIIQHQIPVVVISRKYWSDILRMDLPPCDISVFMPPLRLLRNVIERLKNWENVVILSVFDDGTLSLKMERELTTKVESKFKNSELNKEVKPSRREAYVRLDAKRFSLYFNSLQAVQHNHLICNVSHRKVAHFVYLQDDTSLQFILPHIQE